MDQIAIDIGYGDTKICTAADKYYKFPTAVSRKKEAQADFSTDNSYSFNGIRFRVGNQVLLDAITTRGFDFLVKYAPLLAYHASGSMLQGAEIVTGLSIVNWSERQRYYDALSKFIVNDKIIVPAKIRLLAQGQGVINIYKGSKKGVVCIVDIGYNTFDFLVFEDGKPRTDLSFATKQGTNTMVTDLQAVIKNRFDIEVSELEAKQIFEAGKMKIYSEEKDLSDYITNALDFYNDFIISEIKSKRVDVLRKASKVIFAGGGAYYLKNKQLPSNAIFTEKPYEYANVRGYYAQCKGEK